MIAAGAATGVVGAMAGAVIPITPMRHQYVVTQPLPEDVEGIPRCATPTTSCTCARTTPAGCWWAATRASRSHGTPTRRWRSRARTFEPDMDRFAESWEGARKRVPALRVAGAGEGGERARRRSPRTGTSSWARPRSRACGRPPASASTAWRAPAAWARSWPNGSPTAGPSTTWRRWTSAASARTTRRPPTRACARSAPTRATTTSSTRTRSSTPAGRCGCPPPTRGWSSWTPSSARRQVGSA